MKKKFKLELIFLVAVILFTMVSCGETEIIDKCQEINCSDQGKCEVVNNKAACVCNENYHAEGFECIENTLECKITEHEDNGVCINNIKEVDCIDVTPDNATSSNIKTEIIWENGSWSKADNCEWECKEGYRKQENKCINDKDIFNVKVMNISEHSCKVIWDGNPNAKTWLYVHELKTTGPKHDVIDNAYKYTNLGSDYTFTLFIKGNGSESINEVVFSTLADESDSPIIIKANGKTEIEFSKAKYINNSRTNTDEVNGISLLDETDSNVDENEKITTPDIIYRVKAEESGTYWISTISSINEFGREQFEGNTSKYDSLFMKIELKGDISTQKAVKRVVYVPWAVDKDTYKSKLDRFYFNGDIQDINIWLPQGVILKNLIVEKYIPPTVPAEVENYEPSITPSMSRPRLWVNHSSLIKVKNNLEVGRNKDIWEDVKVIAMASYDFPYTENEMIIKEDKDVEKEMQYKAFYYLMEQDSIIGRESIDIAKKYIKALDFGNILDVTRPVGNAIYTVSLVYDWCYDLLTSDEKALFIEKFKYLAESMEIGWPPFRQAITVGHGSEEQLSKNLLAMSIAIYNEDPIPYKYTSYRILEELSSMRQFEYQSPRHHQGMSYGPYRYRADLEAALLFKKMSGIEVFDENIKNVYKSFFYRRLTNKDFFNDGDNFSQYYSGNINYGTTSLIHYAYSKDSSEDDLLILAKLSKGDIALNSYNVFKDRVLTLLLNDPDFEVVLPNEEGLSALPLTLFTGKIVGSMIARTGWDMSENTSDVVVDVKGGGYFFANHQHADAGSFQIFYKGKQVVDLGQYHYYGTPYDVNFNKRSVAHSMLLVVDPNEENVNDGGTRKISGSPVSEEYINNNDPKYLNGEIISESTEPLNSLSPDFSYYSLDLTSAYSGKLERYQRKSVFLNLKNNDIPAILIMLDIVKTSNPDFKKYWQINTLNLPEIDNNGNILIHNSIEDGNEGDVIVNMLEPISNNRTVEFFSGANSTTVFGTHYTAPNPDKPEANGTRIMISPINSNIKDIFLTAFTMKTPEAAGLSISSFKSQDNNTSHILVGNNILVIMNNTDELLSTSIDIDITSDDTKLFVGGLEHGNWVLSGGGVEDNIIVEEGRNTIYYNSLGHGSYVLSKQTN